MSARHALKPHARPRQPHTHTQTITIHARQSIIQSGADHHARQQEPPQAPPKGPMILIDAAQLLKLYRRLLLYITIVAFVAILIALHAVHQMERESPKAPGKAPSRARPIQPKTILLSCIQPRTIHPPRSATTTNLANYNPSFNTFLPPEHSKIMLSMRALRMSGIERMGS